MPAKRSSAARQRKKPREKAPSPPRPPTRKARAKGGTSDRKGESKILAHLGPEDARIALSIFAERHPELVPELEGIIREVGAGVAFQDVANKVVAAIAELTMFDLARNHAADQFHYKGETETAWDVFEETLAPFVEALDRMARMGLVEAALQQCQGVLLGLYRAEHERVSELLDWIPDGVPELTYGPLKGTWVHSTPTRGQWKPHGRQGLEAVRARASARLGLAAGLRDRRLHADPSLMAQWLRVACGSERFAPFADVPRRRACRHVR